MPNKLSQFWQELKRRNVVRVITVYAGAAFVIIELINNITEPLHLPDWTPTLVIVLLATGFPVVIIFSWIYDVHPERGMVKTEPSHKVKAEDIPHPSSGWKIASYISFVVIVGLIVLNIIPRTGKKEILDKSIAVLPFHNDSPDEEKMYFINGTMDAILDNLCKIADLRVVSRNSVEQYRDNPKPTPVVAEEMNVSYVLEGSGQKIGNRVLLIVQLIDGKTDQHLWSKQYDREIEKVEDLIDIQKEISELVAVEIKAVITPQEQELIEKIPTTNLTAYDFYQMGMEARKNRDRERAEFFFNEALRYDSTFAQAYTGLARIYWGSEGELSENWLDTARILLDKALSYDPELAEVHTLYGRYYNQLNDTIRAMREVDKAIALNPNDFEAYIIKAGIKPGYINQISNIQKAILLNRGPELQGLLGRLAYTYWFIGLWDKAAEVYEEMLKLSGDSARYIYNLTAVEFFQGNLNAAIELFKKSLGSDSIQGNDAYWFYYIYEMLGESEQALRYGKRWVDGVRASGMLGAYVKHRVGYYYWHKGLEEEADYYFNLQIEYCLQVIELERPMASERNLETYYNLAATYAFTGETEKAIENLRIYITRPVMDARMLFFLRYDWLLDPIRDHPEFQQILLEAESKYQAEYERVSEWMEENDML